MAPNSQLRFWCSCTWCEAQPGSWHKHVVEFSAVYMEAEMVRASSTYHGVQAAPSAEGTAAGRRRRRPGGGLDNTSNNTHASTPQRHPITCSFYG